MQRASSKEFSRGMGRTRTLMRQAFGHWPGAPVTRDGDTLVWLSFSNQAKQSQIAIDGLRLREMEQTLTCLVHHHRDHLDFVLPDAADWLQRASNCLELLKEFLHKPPSTQSATTQSATTQLSWLADIDKLRIATRWKQRIFDLARRWPKLQPLLWQLCFLELTSPTSGRLACLPWLEAHAESLAALMHRTDGVQLALMLLQTGPHIDERWLHTMFEFLADESLGKTPYLASFSHADDLAQALRDRLKDKAVEIPNRREAPTLADKFIAQLRSYLTMKPGVVSKITALLGAVARDDLSTLVRVLSSRARMAEKRLLKELRKVGLLGLQYYVESVGLQRALSSAHVVTNLREEGQSLLDLFSLAEGLTDSKCTLDGLPTASQFFERMDQLKIACRIRLAWRWHECGWQGISSYLPSVYRLISRRGCHIELHKHWLRRLWPSVAAQPGAIDVVEAGLRNTDVPGRLRSIQLLERLVYDLGEQLSEAAVLAIMKLATAVPSLDAAVNLYRKLDKEVLASVELRELREAYRISTEANEFRMALAWFRLHPDAVRQVTTLRWAYKRPEHMELLNRLLIKRDHAAIARWSEGVDLLESLNVPLPQVSSPAHSLEWISHYPVVFHDQLTKLAHACVHAETVAAELLREACHSPARLMAEMETLKGLLSDRAWSEQQAPERLARIGKRIENLQQRLAEPPVVTPERAARLIEKLSDRVDREMLNEVQELARRSLEASLGDLNIEGLRERLQLPPYNRILPALRKLKDNQQQVAWRALRSSWDNSLKLLSEPANQRFLQQMQSKGLELDAWLSSELSLEGQQADGTPYRVAFTQDPLDILLMGHHFDTCLALDGVNFHSTVANLVDANKRVLFGRTESGQVVGRCLFALTNQGQLKTFHRYQHCAADGFDRLVDEFAEKLVLQLGTSQTESGQVSCLVSRSWYDDGCVSVPNSPRGKSYRLQELLSAQPDADPYELALQVFGSDDELVHAAGIMYECGLFNELRVVRSLFPKLSRASVVPISLRLRLASMIWGGGDRELARHVFAGVPCRDIWRSIGRETLSELVEERSFADLIVDHDRVLARRLLRSKKAVGSRQ